MDVRHRIPRLLAILSWALAMVCFVSIVNLGRRYLESGLSEIAGVEPFFVYFVQKIRCGMDLYTHPLQVPFDSLNYTPLSFQVMAWILDFCHVLLEDVPRVFAVLRMSVIVAGVMWIVGLVAFMMRCLKVPFALSCVAGSFVYVCSVPWLFTIRMDAFTSSLTLVAVAAAYCSWHTPSGKAGMFWAALGTILTILCKQTGVQIFMAIVAFLAWKREWTRLRNYVLSCAWISALAFILYGWDTVMMMKVTLVDEMGGEFWSLNEAIFRSYQHILHPRAWIVVPTLVLAVKTLREGGRELQFLSFAVLFTFGIAALTSLKVGSSVHYFNDFQALAFCLLAWGVTHHVKCPWTLSGIHLLLMVSITMTAILDFNAYHMKQPWKRDDFNRAVPLVQALGCALEEHPGTLFHTDETLLPCYYPRSVVMATIRPTDRFPYLLDLEDYASVRRSVREGRLKWVVTRKEVPELPGIGRVVGRLRARVDGYGIHEIADPRFK